MVNGGEESRCVVVDAAMSQRGADGDEAGQVLVFGAEAIGDPRAHAGADEGVAAGVQFEKRAAVPRVGTMHGPNDAQVVHTTGNVREYLADPLAALAVLGEAKRRLQQVAGPAGNDARPGKRQRLAIIAL